MTERYRADKSDIEALRIARKYKLRPGTKKFVIFCLFEDGHSPQEVRYILRDTFIDRKDPLRRSISRYYHTWKSFQSNE